MPGRGEDVTDATILRVLREQGPQATTADIMTHLPIKRNQTLERLKTLQRDGQVTGYKIGGSWVWSVSD